MAVSAEFVLVIGAAIFGPAGTAWIGVRAGLNGVKTSIRNIEKNQDTMSEQLTRMDKTVAIDHHRLAQIERTCASNHQRIVVHNKEADNE